MSNSAGMDEPGATWVGSVSTEDEGPATVDSSPVLVDIIELFRPKISGECPDVGAEGPLDDVMSSVPVNRPYKT